MAISYVSSAGIQGAITAGTAFSAAPIINATFNGTTTMTVNSISAGAVVIGQVLYVSPYPTVTAQLTGTSGGAGTYTLSAAVSAQTNNIYATGFDFLNVPSWVRRITVVYDSISNSGAQIGTQLGTASGIVATGYTCSVFQNNATGLGYGNSTTDFRLTVYNNSGGRYSGTVVFTLVGSNVWVQQGILADGFNIFSDATSGGRVALPGALTTVRVSAGQAAGSDIFDGGTFNILYE